MRSRSVPCTRSRLSSTPFASRGPMAQEHEAWWPQALSRTYSGKLFVGLHRLARQFLLPDQAAPLQLPGHPADKAQRRHHRPEVVPGGIAAFLEVAEVHQSAYRVGPPSAG